MLSFKRQKYSKVQRKWDVRANVEEDVPLRKAISEDTSYIHFKFSDAHLVRPGKLLFPLMNTNLIHNCNNTNFNLLISRKKLCDRQLQYPSNFIKPPKVMIHKVNRVTKQTERMMRALGIVLLCMFIRTAEKNIRGCYKK